MQARGRPSGLNETDMYRELRPPTQLRSAISCLWLREGEGRAVRVLPDGCVDLVWRSGVGAIVAGPDTKEWLSACEPDELLWGVRFLPGAGGAALGLPLSELRDRRAGWDELGLTGVPRLDADLDPAAVPALLMATAARLVERRPPDRLVQAAVVQLLDPAGRVEHISRALSVSERQLRRRFLDAVGYGPKTLQRVLRLRRFLTGPADDLARAAAQAGYADQAHLARECRRLTGRAPRELVGTP